jgi:hypothetical protein
MLAMRLGRHVRVPGTKLSGRGGKASISGGVNEKGAKRVRGTLLGLRNAARCALLAFARVEFGCVAPF